MSYRTGHHGFVGVVGESAYQDALRGLPEVFTAKLVPEPQNPYDSSAVAVMTVDGRTVGYLARDIAESYQPPLLQQPQAVTCPAKLTGGGDQLIGLVLDFEPVRHALGLPLIAVDRGPMDYDAVAEYHRINHESRDLVRQARPLERTDVDAAAAQYRQALALIQECHAVAASRGLLAHGFLPNQTDTVALERLVLCLIKLKRIEDARREIDAYCEKFPHARQMRLLANIRKRIETASV